MYTSKEQLDADLRLKKLNGKIWRQETRTSRQTERRNLTEEEWNEVRSIIIRFELPCELQAGSYGFALHVYGNDAAPGIPPSKILVIDCSQFPFESAKEGFAGQEQTLNKLKSLTHSKRNKEMLEWMGVPPLREPSHYAY